VTGINLIPPDVLQSCRRRRRTRLWVALTIVAAAAAALPMLWQLRQHARLAELLRIKQSKTAETVAAREALADTVRELSKLTDRVEQADALRTKRPWAELLSLTSRCLPEEVWLTSIDTEKPSGSAKRRTAPAPDGEDQPTVVVMEGARRMALAGYAVGHEQLYEFMSRLKASAVFDRVDLLKADKEQVLWSEAVRFELVCIW
jgi:Tfp pilus assembly protein PilN